MKLSNVIKRIEKKTGKKFEGENGRFYMRLENNTVSFYENEKGSGETMSITVTMHTDDDNPMNANCYKSYHRTIKSAVNAISADWINEEVKKEEAIDEDKEVENIEVIETKEDHQEIIETEEEAKETKEIKEVTRKINHNLKVGDRIYNKENNHHGIITELFEDEFCNKMYLVKPEDGTNEYYTMNNDERIEVVSDTNDNKEISKETKEETKADNIDHNSFLYIADEVNEIEELNEQDELTKPIESDYKTSNKYLKALQEWREETGNYNQYEQKQEARADRFEERAGKAEERSNQAYNQSKQVSDMIPFGQPILIGHHSEKRARKDHERINSNMKKSIDESDKAKYYENKAENARNNHSISSDDDDAVIKLKAKIETAKDSQEKMKAINKAVKKKDIAKGDEDLKKMGYNDEQIKDIRTPDFMGRIGFAGYQLTNNNANIKRMEKRLETLEKQAADETTEIEFDGGTIIDNVEENRLQVDFDEKPSEEIRTKLKRNGFKWARSLEVWQRFRSTQAMWIAKDIVNCC